MSRVVGIDGDGVLVAEFGWAESPETVGEIPPELTAVSAPDWAVTGWRLADGRWLAPEMPGWVYDYDGMRYITHDEYRRILHARTTDDTMEALRKLREGDTTMDWEARLVALDAYNLALEETKHQDTYPDVVVYPEYPEKPRLDETS